MEHYPATNPDVEIGSGNVFADLDLPDANVLLLKSNLVVQITRALGDLGLTQTEAGLRMGISQAKVSGLLRGDVNNLSERKLMECLLRLGYDIAIQIKPAGRPVGQLIMDITP